MGFIFTRSSEGKGFICALLVNSSVDRYERQVLVPYFIKVVIKNKKL